jgi:hypothetical protein
MFWREPFGRRWNDDKRLRYKGVDMPSLLKPDRIREVELTGRRGIVAAETDVLVVGGGPAGLGAALGAATSGARVILAEQMGFFGGRATASLVMPWSSYYTHSGSHNPYPHLTLFPTDHGKGKPVLGGIVEKVVDRMVAAGGAARPSLANGYTIPFDPEMFKLVSLDMLDDAGVNYLLRVFASGLAGPSIDDGVVFESKSGPLVVKGRVTVDCTGDGDVAAAAGAEFSLGCGEGITQPMTLIFMMAGFSRRHFEAYVREHPSDWSGVQGLRALIREAIRKGEADLPREDILFFGTTRDGVVSVNSTRVQNVCGTDAWDLSYAEAEAHRQVRRVSEFLIKHVPGFENACLTQSGCIIGVRETRHIVGDYLLSPEDVMFARKFDDVIARSTYPVDIHDPRGKGTMVRDIPLNDYYDIPLRCLLPRGIDGLVTAGSCISGAHVAHASFRVMPVSMATGQAAGVCAALAAERRSSVHHIPFREVQQELRLQGALV